MEFFACVEEKILCARKCNWNSFYLLLLIWEGMGVGRQLPCARKYILNTGSNDITVHVCVWRGS